MPTVVISGRVDKDAFAGSTVRCVTSRECLTKVVQQDERRMGFEW